jgi:hypothetical protein
LSSFAFLCNSFAIVIQTTQFTHTKNQKTMITSVVSFLASGLIALATLVNSPVAAPAAELAELPEAFEFAGFSAAESAGLIDGARCNPRSVVNSVPALRACVIAGKLPGSEYDIDIEDISTCPDGSLRFRVIIYNDFPGSAPDVDIAEIFVCNCTVESWTCL